MNISIRKQLTTIFAGLIVALFLANFLVNTLFLEEFYYIQKQQVLRDAYTTLNKQINEDGLMSKADTQAYEQMCNKNGIAFVVTNEDYVETMWMNNMTDMDIILARLNGYGIGYDSGVVLEQTEDYTLQKKYDNKLGLNFLEIWGRLDKGFYFLMRISIEGIRDSVRISNEFIKYICVFGVVFGGIIIWFVSRRVTQPLNRLTELSKRMADLDFDAKYTGGGGNEIGQLGEHFNRMSEKLQSAYSQLLTANNELQKDIERKEQVDEMRKEFLSNVSHELKTPIALIQGYAEGLQECINDDAESREFYCDVIMDEASKMNGLVQKLLTLNQLEFGNDQVVMERFDLAVLIRNKIQSVSILAQQKETEITYDGEDSLPVWGDEFKVEEILTNYLSNALNHIDGARRIRVTAQCGNTHVRVTVENTGAPIPQADIGRIWDKFYKVDKARTREYGGSGVGLSIVKAIMESFHQRYGVYNTDDGVAFWFELKNGNSEVEDDGRQELICCSDYEADRSGENEPG